MFFQLDKNSIIREILDANIVYDSDENACGVSTCKTDIDAMENEVTLLEVEVKEMRLKYHAMLIENLKKDFEIKELKAQLKEQTKYVKFEKNFSSNAMETMRSYGDEKAQDSKFILTAVRDLYDGRLEDLQTKNLSGRSKGATKQPVTPEKMKILKEIFEERITYSKSDERKTLSQNVKTAIQTINNKKC